MRKIQRAVLTWPVILSAMTLSLLIFSGSAYADEDIEDFSYKSWDVSYDLELDPQGHAHAQVSEELVAQFPQADQNRGIIRSLPLRYQGASAAPEDITVTDASGNSVPFETEDDNGFRNILIGDDSFVHGTQTYVINYQVNDVVHATDEVDEFYWDVVPVDRKQDIDQVHAEVSLDSSLESASTGSTACYLGDPNDTSRCDTEAFSGDAAYEVSTTLNAGQGLTVAIGFEPGTVTQPPERQDSFMLDVLPLILSGGAVLVAGTAALAVVFKLRHYRLKASQTTDTLYGLAEDLNPLLAHWITGKGRDVIIAEILDLAVRGIIQIEAREKRSGIFSTKTKYQPVLRLINPVLATDPLDKQILAGLFPGLGIDSTFDFPKNSTEFTHIAQYSPKVAGQAAIERGYQQKIRHRPAAIAGWVALGLVLVVAVLAILGIHRDTGAALGIALVLSGLAVLLAIFDIVKHRVLTTKGGVAKAQLDQVRQVLEASEARRLELMQSFMPEDAKTPETQDDRGAIIELYDRLLPYAVLFGLQKHWTKVMSEAYQRHRVIAPLWYPGLMDHGAAGFSDALGQMLSSVSSAASTSSPGTGSTGGGFAGGGGGGGAAGGR